MDREQIFYDALSGRKTDRVPSLSLIADPNVMNQVLGLKPSRLLPFLESEKGARLVDRWGPAASRLFDLAMFFFDFQTMLTNQRLGFDGMIISYWRFAIRNHKVLMDCFGRVYDIVDDGYGNPYMMYRRGLIESPDQWRKWPQPVIAGYAAAGARIYRLMKFIWGKKIAVIPWTAPGLWENCWQPMSLPGFLRVLKRDPGFAKEMIGYYASLAVACIDAYCDAGARVVGMGDDLGYKTGPMLSPSMLEELFGDSYRRLTSTAHRHGSRIFIHSCGNSDELLEKFIEWGFDGAHAFEPTAMNDLAEARRKVGDRLCLIGNIDVAHTLVDARRDEVEAEVEKAVRDSEGGGFILAPAHSHASVNAENVRWMLEAARGISP